MKTRFAMAMMIALLAGIWVPRLPAQGQFGTMGGLGGGHGSAGFFPGGGMRGSFRAGGMHGSFRGHAGGYYGRSHFAGRGRYFNRAGYLVGPYFYPPDFYSDYFDEEPAAQQAPPQVVVVQVPTAAADRAPATPPAESLVLELRGNRWVRITNSGEVPPGANSPEAIPQVSRRSVANPTSPPSPAVLVFRDGHQEQIQKYTIIGPILYARADYWASGSWTRKIPIADLDTAATLRMNQARGVPFNFPSAPNQVIVQP